jgi:PAS domain S-box-containing protein
MPKVQLSPTASIVVRTACAGWVAAIYGALYIYATADFASTGSLWIFGWPFVAALVVATVIHLLLAGMLWPWLPSPVGWVNDVNVLCAPQGRPETAAAPTLERVLRWLPAAPKVEGAFTMVLAVAVVLYMAVLEWVCGGSLRNVGPVLIGGLIATLLYGTTTFTLTELLIAKPCQRLRLAAVRRDLDPYPGVTVSTRMRVAILAAPTFLALLVAPRLTANLHDAWMLHATVVFLATALSVGLAWLHALAIRHAAADLGEAASRLTTARRVNFITGAIDTQIVDMARAFNGAADEVDRSLQNAAARYSALFEGAGDAILLVDAASGGIIEANRRAQELTGLGVAALKATRFEWLFRPGTRLAGLASDGRDGARCSTATILRSDGSECPVDVAVSFVELAEGTVLQAILHDVGARERIEAELRNSVRRLEELHRLAVSMGGTVEEVAERVAGTLATLLDVPLVALERHEGDELVTLAAYENGIVTRGQRMPLAGTPCERLRADRTPCIFTDVSTMFPEDLYLTERGVYAYAGAPIFGRDGDVVGAVVVMDGGERTFGERDLQLLSTFAERLARMLDEEEYARERDVFVRQLTAQNAALTAAKEHLTEADRLKSMFMGMMSHELRTPLNIFLGYTDLLLDVARDDASAPIGGQRDVFERMLLAARVLTNLVEDTLSVLRLESAGVRVNREPVELASLFDELRNAERYLRPASEVDERWIVEAGLAAFDSDRLKLRQIVTNLVGNARKFTASGAIVVEARSAGEHGVTITVADTGCGIAGADLPHVFELYRQAGEGETGNGCGIGLFIVQRYCALLGGRVEVASERGRGSCFTVWLPRTVAEQTAEGDRLSA